jgi:homoserine kinase
VGAQVERVAIKVPATSANLGPGFDSFGFALDVWNTVTVSRAEKFSMTVTGEGADRLRADEKNIIPKMAYRAMETLGVPVPPLKFECRNAVPPTRGMGSSSAALVAGLAAGLALSGKDLSTPATKKLLLQLAAEEEGHADNVAPAIYGGFQIAFQAEKQWITQRVTLPDGLQCVLFIPDDEMSTKEARAALPEALPYEDAVFNISRAAMLVNCFATAQFDPLRYAMQDRLHQPYRTHMFPFEPFIDTAIKAGAHGAFLSGAGPTVLAIAGGVGVSNPGSDTMSQFLAEAVREQPCPAPTIGCTLSRSSAEPVHPLPPVIRLTPWREPLCATGERRHAQLRSREWHQRHRAHLRGDQLRPQVCGTGQGRGIALDRGRRTRAATTGGRQRAVMPTWRSDVSVSA